MKTSIAGIPLLIGDTPPSREELDPGVDDSLILGWSTKGQPKSTGYAALSTSRAKLFAEDPQKYYLEKIERIKKPMAMPLIFGIGGHYGVEVFLERWPEEGFREAAIAGLDAAEEKIAEKWPEVEDPTVRENIYNLCNPRGRTEIALSLSDLKERVTDVLWESFCVIEEEQEFPLFAAQRNMDRVEASIGELAIENDLPHHTIESYDPVTDKYGEMPVAVVGGVPVRGRIDAVVNMPDESQLVLDHKFVTKVVSYYPPYNGQGPWKRYDPSYNVADSLQLDLYSVGTGIAQGGFQFMLRRPQYMPPDRTLYDDWVRYDEYNGEGYPTFIDETEDGAYMIALYRDTPSQDEQDQMWHRAYIAVRAYAQALTESHILLDNGVDPTIAFPAGDPEEIGRKACPYCFHGPSGTGRCPNPRMVDSKAKARASKKSFQTQLAQREEVCENTPAITERREHWHQTYGVRSWLAL